MSLSRQSASINANIMAQQLLAVEAEATNTSAQQAVFF